MGIIRGITVCCFQLLLTFQGVCASAEGAGRARRDSDLNRLVSDALDSAQEAAGGLLDKMDVSALLDDAHNAIKDLGHQAGELVEEAGELAGTSDVGMDDLHSLASGLASLATDLADKAGKLVEEAGKLAGSSDVDIDQLHSLASGLANHAANLTNSSEVNMDKLHGLASGLANQAAELVDKAGELAGSSEVNMDKLHSLASGLANQAAELVDKAGELPGSSEVKMDKLHSLSSGLANHAAELVDKAGELAGSAGVNMDDVHSVAGELAGGVGLDTASLAGNWWGEAGGVLSQAERVLQSSGLDPADLRQTATTLLRLATAPTFLTLLQHVLGRDVTPQDWFREVLSDARFLRAAKEVMEEHGDDPHSPQFLAAMERLVQGHAEALGGGAYRTITPSAVCVIGVCMLRLLL